jgi:hypothetical protein
MSSSDLTRNSHAASAREFGTTNHVSPKADQLTLVVMEGDPAAARPRLHHQAKPGNSHALEAPLACRRQPKTRKARFAARLLEYCFFLYSIEPLYHTA